MNNEDKINAYINIATMFDTKPTKKLIEKIPKKDLVNVCYKLFETVETLEQENIQLKSILDEISIKKRAKDDIIRRY